MLKHKTLFDLLSAGIYISWIPALEARTHIRHILRLVFIIHLCFKNGRNYIYGIRDLILNKLNLMNIMKLYLCLNHRILDTKNISKNINILDNLACIMIDLHIKMHFRKSYSLFSILIVIRDSNYLNLLTV